MQRLDRCSPTLADRLLAIASDSTFLGVRLANRAIAWDPTVSTASTPAVSNGAPAGTDPWLADMT